MVLFYFVGFSVVWSVCALGWAGFLFLFFNKTLLPAPPQDGASPLPAPRLKMAPTSRKWPLRQLPPPPARHGGDAAGAEPDAAAEPLRGPGGGAAGPRGVAAGEGETRPGLPGGERPGEAREPPAPQSRTAREPPPDEPRPVSAAERSAPALALSRAFATQYFHLQAFSPQYVAALEDMLRELKLQSW